MNEASISIREVFGNMNGNVGENVRLVRRFCPNDITQLERIVERVKCLQLNAAETLVIRRMQEVVDALTEQGIKESLARLNQLLWRSLKVSYERYPEYHGEIDKKFILLIRPKKDSECVPIETFLKLVSL